MTRSDDAAPPVFKSPEGEARYLRAYDAVVRAWPVPHEELDVPSRFGSTHVIASGPPDAPPLLLLPSLAGSATLWRPNVARLSRKHRVYAVDVIGQVGKSVPTRRPRTRGDFADWLVDVLDALGVERASLAGSSYGGFLALSQASLTPGRVDRVVLISPAGTFVGGLWRLFVRMMVGRLLRRKQQRSITDLLGPGSELAPEDAAWGELMKVTMAESGRPSLTPPVVLPAAELRAIRAPTLLLIGEKEIIYDAERTLQHARKRMPSLTGAVVPGAHHLAALACPDEVDVRILEFLDGGRLDAARSA
jgi:pimeloyl-ACP methyl ester carboxylesterase